MKKLIALLTVLVLVFSLTACGGEEAKEEPKEDTKKEDVKEDEKEDVKEEEKEEVKEEEKEDAKEEEKEEVKEAVSFNVGILKGPTGFGMSKLYDRLENKELDLNGTIKLAPTPDKIVPMIVSGELQMACVPTNMASVLYKKTEGGVQLAAINTLGVLYLVADKEIGENIKSFEDLKGLEVSGTGKGAVPEFLTEYLLSQNGINSETDLTMDYSLSHQELGGLVASGEKKIAILPQPFVTTTLMKNPDLMVALDFNEEWAKFNPDTSITTGCLIVNKEFAENNPELVSDFLTAYEESINWVNENPAEAGALIEKYEIFPKAKVAEKAIPHCAITYIDGDKAEECAKAFLQVLFDANPKSVGGQMPDADFYYKK